MSEYDFNDILVVKDDINDLEIMRSIVETKNRENAFYIMDIGCVVKKHLEWISKMPRVSPHFAVKCNPHPIVIKTLVALNGCFDCASQHEIQKVMAMGAPGDRIIFAHPAKLNSHISYAKQVGVRKMTVDSKEEIMKIKDIFPSAELVIRIRNDGLIDKTRMTSLGEKFGCNAEVEAPILMQLIKKMEMTLIGFSFHAGSPCPDNHAYSSGIKVCKNLVDYGRSIGMRDIRMIDIGGGFVGTDQLDDVAQAVNEALEDIDESIEIISEPGRYYVESACTLAALVHSQKEITEGNTVKRSYYINDGCYGSFCEELLSLKARCPINLHKKIFKLWHAGELWKYIFQQESNDEEKFLSTIWGPTCDSYDCVIKNTMLPKFAIGDWMVWLHMGAYTLSRAGRFNGMLPPDVYAFIRKCDMEVLKVAINQAQNSYVAKSTNGVTFHVA